MQPLRVTSIMGSVLALLVTTAIVGARQLTKEEVPGIRNYTQVDATVACAGATAPEAVAELKRRGFVSVINFRTEGERGAMLEEEAAAMREAEMKYFHIPFQSSAPTTEATEEFLEVVADPANQPVLIHCGSANRVGAMWLIKRVKLDGWEVDRATTEAEAIGLRSPVLREFALNYVQQ